jgi:hypothetical protein
MRRFNKFLVILYSTFYKEGNYKNDDPEVRLWKILSGVSALGLISIAYYFSLIFRNESVLFDYSTYAIALLTIPVLVYFHFKLSKIQVLYDEIYEKENVTSKDRLIAWLIIGLIIIFGFSPAILKLVGIIPM